MMSSSSPLVFNTKSRQRQVNNKLLFITSDILSFCFKNSQASIVDEIENNLQNSATNQQQSNEQNDFSKAVSILMYLIFILILQYIIFVQIKGDDKGQQQEGDDDDDTEENALSEVI